MNILSHLHLILVTHRGQTVFQLKNYEPENPQPFSLKWLKPSRKFYHLTWSIIIQACILGTENVKILGWKNSGYGFCELGWWLLIQKHTERKTLFNDMCGHLKVNKLLSWYLGQNNTFTGFFSSPVVFHKIKTHERNEVSYQDVYCTKKRKKCQLLFNQLSAKQHKYL